MPLLLVQVLEIFFTLVTLIVFPALLPDVPLVLLPLVLALELGLVLLGEVLLAEPSEPFTWTSSPTCLLSWASSPCSSYVVPALSVRE